LEDRTDRQLLEAFVRRQDASAFAGLVRRHGPLVLRVCRRILGNAHDAEDAFQATFLVLFRKAGSLRTPELLANWLYGVASRTARKARTRFLRRRQRESLCSWTLATEPAPDPANPHLQMQLDQELHYLPDKYRLPLILCYLEGMTNAEAARHLGWPAGSMSFRLARGRELLRERLAAESAGGRLPGLEGVTF
jgi:RNA polymerase sigma factor (sigma-70 family)